MDRASPRREPDSIHKEDTAVTSGGSLCVLGEMRGCCRVPHPVLPSRPRAGTRGRSRSAETPAGAPAARWAHPGSSEARRWRFAQAGGRRIAERGRQVAPPPQGRAGVCRGPLAGEEGVQAPPSLPFPSRLADGPSTGKIRNLFRRAGLGGVSPGVPSALPKPVGFENAY